MARFMEKKGLKTKEREDTEMREEEGCVQAHKDGDSASVPIEIPKLPQVP